MSMMKYPCIIAIFLVLLAWTMATETQKKVQDRTLTKAEPRFFSMFMNSPFNIFNFGKKKKRRPRPTIIIKPAPSYEYPPSSHPGHSGGYHQPEHHGYTDDHHEPHFNEYHKPHHQGHSEHSHSHNHNDDHNSYHPHDSGDSYDHNSDHDSGYHSHGHSHSDQGYGPPKDSDIAYVDHGHSSDYHGKPHDSHNHHEQGYHNNDFSEHPNSHHSHHEEPKYISNDHHSSHHNGEPHHTISNHDSPINSYEEKPHYDTHIDEPHHVISHHDSPSISHEEEPHYHEQHHEGPSNTYHKDSHNDPHHKEIYSSPPSNIYTEHESADIHDIGPKKNHLSEPEIEGGFTPLEPYDSQEISKPPVDIYKEKDHFVNLKPSDKPHHIGDSIYTDHTNSKPPQFDQNDQSPYVQTDNNQEKDLHKELGATDPLHLPPVLSYSDTQSKDKGKSNSLGNEYNSDPPPQEYLPDSTDEKNSHRIKDEYITNNPKVTPDSYIPPVIPDNYGDPKKGNTYSQNPEKLKSPSNNYIPFSNRDKNIPVKDSSSFDENSYSKGSVVKAKLENSFLSSIPKKNSIGKDTISSGKTVDELYPTIYRRPSAFMSFNMEKQRKSDKGSPKKQEKIEPPPSYDDSYTPSFVSGPRRPSSSSNNESILKQGAPILENKTHKKKTTRRKVLKKPSNIRAGFRYTQSSRNKIKPSNRPRAALQSFNDAKPQANRNERKPQRDKFLTSDEWPKKFT